jgi:hypothetical protein
LKSGDEFAPNAVLKIALALLSCPWLRFSQWDTHQDLGSAESCVQNSVNVPLNSNQFSALVDFTFNLGCGSLQSSTLLRILNQNDYSGVPAQMMRWTYAGGQQLPGLVTRRQNEGTLWNTPVSGGGSTAPMTTPVATTQPGTAGPASSSAVALGTSQVGSAAPTTNPAAQGSTASAALFAEVLCSVFLSCECFFFVLFFWFCFCSELSRAHASAVSVAFF